MNKYQQRINKEAFLLVHKNPALLQKRGQPLKEARKALHDKGYEYAHGNKNRSKTLRKQIHVNGTKSYSTENPRKERLEEIARKTSSLKIRLDFLERRKS